MTRQCFDEFHRLFGIRYPFGNYHQAFVPEFNAGAMENPGCVTFRDPLVFTLPGHPRHAHPAGHDARARDGAPVVRQHHHPEVVGRPLAQRVLRRVHGQPGHRRRHGVRRRLGPQRLRPPPVGTASPTSGRAPTRSPATARRTRPPRCRTSTASPTPRARAILKQLNARARRRRLLRRRHRPLRRGTGSATPRCTTSSQSGRRAGAGDLSAFTTNWLRTAGPDRIALDRAAGGRPPYSAGRRTLPTASTRSGVATASPGGSWKIEPLTVAGDATPFDARAARPSCSTRTRTPGPLVAARPRRRCTLLKTLLPATDDARLRAGIWNNVRSAFHNAAIDPADVLDLVEASMPIEDSDDAVRDHAALGVRARSPPLAADPEARAGLASTRRLAAKTLGDRTGLDAAARGLPAADRARATDPVVLRALARGRRARRHRRRPRRCAGGSCPAGARSARPTAPSSTSALAAEPTAESRGRARPGDGVAARRRGQGLGVGPVHRRGRRAQLRARGGRASACGAAGRSTSPTPYVDRYFDELPATAAGAQRLGAGRRGRSFFPITVADGRDAGRPGRARWPPTTTSTSPCAAGWSTWPTSCAAGSP